MKTSDSIGELAAALALAQPGIKNAVAGSDNPFFKSKYADLEAVKDACMPALAAQGIAVVQCPVVSEGKVGVITRMIHKSGQWMEGELLLPTTKQDPQAYGSAVSYSRRYSLAAFAGVATTDDDGNAATHGTPPAKQQAPPPPKKPAPPVAPPAEPDPEPEDVTKLTDVELAFTIIPFGRVSKGKKLGDMPMPVVEAAMNSELIKDAAGKACQRRMVEYHKRALAKIV